MSLPILVDDITARAMLANEERLCDLAESVCELTQDAVHGDHLNAVKLARELMWAHESDNPADKCLHHAALQIKLWHLLQLDNILTASRS